MQAKGEVKRLPLARASKGGNIADASAIRGLFGVVTIPEVVAYFREQFARQVQLLDVKEGEKYHEVISAIDDFVNIVNAQSEMGSGYWSGAERDAVVSRFRNYQEALGREALEQLTTKLAGQVLNFDFAISADSQLQQLATHQDGTELDTNAEAQVNAIFSDWLTSNRMLCQDGVIYHCLENGEPERDKAGQMKKVDQSQYQAMFKGESKDANGRAIQGFAAFVAEKTNSKLTMKVNDLTETYFPSQQQTSAT